MSKTLGQQIVVQNVGGAGGTTGSTRVMRADPDGYTILMGQMGTHAAAPALYPNLAYRPDVDFEPIGLVASFPVLIAARKDFPAKDLKEFIAYVKANHGKLNQGHAGVGSIFFTTCLLLNSHPGGETDPGAVRRRRADHDRADGRPDRLHVRRHHRRRVAATGPATSRSMRSPRPIGIRRCRTCHRPLEAGLPAFQASAWNGLFAPKGTPKPILDRLTDALDKALDDEAPRKRMLQLGSDIPDKKQRGQQALLALVKSEIARWSPIIKAAGVTAK